MLFKNYQHLIANGQTQHLQQKRQDVLDIFSAAMSAVDPYQVVRNLWEGHTLHLDHENLDTSAFHHVYLVGFGKASVGMAQAVCDAAPITKGVIITNDSSTSVAQKTVDVVIGGHPLPNDGSITGAKKVLDLVQQCTPNDLLIVVISGGGSSSSP